MDYAHYFPLGIAKDTAFVGRSIDIDWLHKNIINGVHTVVQSPRRFGKTSLILHTLESKKIPYMEIDLQLCKSARSVEELIISASETALKTLCQNKESIIHLAKDYFAKKNRAWSVELIHHMEFRIKPNDHQNIAENIILILQFLDLVLSKQTEKFVLFFDEIQEINYLSESYEIQGALRHLAQKANNIVFIFSGNMIRNSRDTENRELITLFQLCDTLYLAPIETDIYVNYLAQVYELSFQQTIDQQYLVNIIQLANHHPSRINQLCLHLWRLNEMDHQAFNEQLIDRAWQQLVLSKGKTIRTTLSKLSDEEQRLLYYLSVLDDPNTAINIKSIQANESTIEKSLQNLEQLDFISFDNHQMYHIIDPIVKAVVKQYGSTLFSAAINKNQTEAKAKSMFHQHYARD